MFITLTPGPVQQGAREEEEVQEPVTQVQANASFEPGQELKQASRSNPRFKFPFSNFHRTFNYLGYFYFMLHQT